MGTVLATCDEWTVDHLFQTYPHRFRGVDYVVSRQWTLWRVMSHEIHQVEVN